MHKIVWEHWFEIVLGALAVLLMRVAWVLWDRQDKIEAKQTSMMMQCVTRADLKETLMEMRAERQDMHEENRDALTALRETNDSIKESVNDLAVQIAGLK